MNSSNRLQMIRELKDKIDAIPDIKQIESSLNKCSCGRSPALKKGSRTGLFLAFCVDCPGAISGATETEAGNNWNEAHP